MATEEWGQAAAGVRLTAPAVPRVELQSVIAEAVERSGGLGAEPREVAAKVAEALVAPEVQEELALAFVRALQRASTAFMQRDDIYEYPGNLDTAARVVLDALADLLGRGPVQPGGIDREEAVRTLAEVSYPGITFEFVSAPYPRVIASGVFPDTSEPGEEFPVTQYAVVKGDLVETAFAAVMAVLDHEAREAFRFRGERVFNTHADQGESSGPILKEGAAPDTRRSYVANIGPSAGVRRS